MKDGTCEIGMIGLGVMGRNLVLNMADKGFSVVGYDKDAKQVEALNREAATRPATGVSVLDELVRRLRTPRTVMMLVPAGPPVDAVIETLLAHLQPGDLLIDGGNSHFRETDARTQRLAGRQILYMGVGISGGERGARLGPSIMPGGPRAGYERVRQILEAVAARVDGEACVAYLGPGSAGDYVKMVHNGIEYGMMELIAESYDLMKRGLGLANERLQEVYDQWNRSSWGGYLIEITARIFTKRDDGGQAFLVDMILDEAKQKGTGKWTAQDAMELRAPVPVIESAVSMRDLSDLTDERKEAARALAGPSRAVRGDEAGFIDRLGRAMGACMVIIYAQGMAQLREASRAYGYGLRLEEVARIWRGGCIIRSGLLEPIRRAFHDRPDLTNLLLDPVLGKMVESDQADLRAVVSDAAGHGIPAPAHSACLAYFDAYRSAWLPANLVQAQRDYFGAHGYRRIDREGAFHTEWE
ncbi:MAG: NADP-dependent phosphogluconate dehydrogenase [Syntrophorhabdales bacterium]|jgi:6-phosphogluconate dehydrogenase